MKKTSAGRMGNYRKIWEQICASSFSVIISGGGSRRHAFRKSVTRGDCLRWGVAATFTMREIADTFFSGYANVNFPVQNAKWNSALKQNGVAKYGR